jgi:hypothetical protein
VKIIITRAVMVAGKAREVGSSIELPDQACLELIAMNKATRAPGEPPAAAPGPLTTETAPGLVKGKAKKESQDAGQ